MFAQASLICWGELGLEEPVELGLEVDLERGLRKAVMALYISLYTSSGGGTDETYRKQMKWHYCHKSASIVDISSAGLGVSRVLENLSLTVVDLSHLIDFGFWDAIRTITLRTRPWPKLS